MMLCVDKKMLHESLRRDDSGPFPAAAGNRGHARPEHPQDGHDGPVPAHDQDRREVLLRVVRISDALNQRLAL
jgi:hypothetical protein